METGNKQAISLILRDYKTTQGVIIYEKVLSIPLSERIPEMAKKDFAMVIANISGALTMAFESMNLKRGMNATQVLDLAEAIIDTAGEDNLAFEDLMLFLQKLIRGEYGAMYESMDIPKFMTEFEKYREDRWQELVNIRHSKNSQYKGMGDNTRSNEPNELSIHFSEMANRLSEMNSKIKQLRNENNTLKNNL